MWKMEIEMMEMRLARAERVRFTRMQEEIDASAARADAHDGAVEAMKREIWGDAKKSAAPVAQLLNDWIDAAEDLAEIVHAYARARTRDFASADFREFGINIARLLEQRIDSIAEKEVDYA
jgi:hypothetical protein